MEGIMRNGASGMLCQVRKVDVLANNLANLQTTGFKGGRIGFADLSYRTVQLGIEGGQNPTRLGNGAVVTEVIPDSAQGSLAGTGKSTDLAIDGKGFLGVELPSGEMAYTRDGHLAVAADGYLAHAGTGFPLAGSLSTLSEEEGIVIHPDGRVTQSTDKGGTVEVGRIDIYSFPNSERLKAYGQNLWLENEASGKAQASSPGENGVGQLKAGVLETSNVEVAEQVVEMIEAQRAYQLNARLVVTADEMWSLANGIRG